MPMADAQRPLGGLNRPAHANIGSGPARPPPRGGQRPPAARATPGGRPAPGTACRAARARHARHPGGAAPRPRRGGRGAAHPPQRRRNAHHAQFPGAKRPRTHHAGTARPCPGHTGAGRCVELCPRAAPDPCAAACARRERAGPPGPQQPGRRRRPLRPRPPPPRASAAAGVRRPLRPRPPPPRASAAAGVRRRARPSRSPRWRSSAHADAIAPTPPTSRRFLLKLAALAVLLAVLFGAAFGITPMHNDDMAPRISAGGPAAVLPAGGRLGQQRRHGVHQGRHAVCGAHRGPRRRYRRGHRRSDAGGQRQHRAGKQHLLHHPQVRRWPRLPGDVGRR